MQASQALDRRIVRIEHEIGFAGDRKPVAKAGLVFHHEDGSSFRVDGTAVHQHVHAYYGYPLPHLALEDHGDGEYFGHFAWDSSEDSVLATMDGQTMSVDQLMRFESEGSVGHGIFEILSGGRGYDRYAANWAAMDMAPFRQPAAE